MTWGQIRINLLESSPGIPLDLIDEWINSRYGTLLEATDWIGLKAHTMIQTTAAYQSGADTVTVTVGQSAVTGAGTTWTAARTGSGFYIPGDTATYVVTYVSATSLTLDRPYEGKSGDAAGVHYAASPYVFMTNIYLLPADCRSIVTVLDPQTSLPLSSFTKDGLDASAGTRAQLGYPASWAQYDNSQEPTPPSIAPPVLQRIELFPPPLLAQGFSVEYLRVANRFDGQTLNASPLPFLAQPPTAILAGVRADIALYEEKFAKAAGYEKLFEMEMGRLISLEHTQRRVKTSMKMASRFTRHRLARVNRGQSIHGWSQPGGPT
jgi:hypothetical protein